MKMKTKAIILSAGKGKRMNQSISKQYLMLGEQTILSYSLEMFQKSSIDEIILVTAQDDMEYVKNSIILPHKIDKVTKIVAGGQERYLSVYQGLLAAKDCDYILIHDGARPFLTLDIINDSIQAVQEYHACAVGVPLKDSIKKVGQEGYITENIERKDVWQVQTPQSFSYPLIMEAYEKLLNSDMEPTDDTSVVEYFTETKVKMLFGSYENIKITTPEDLEYGEYLREKRKK
ncbi:MAG: 2-C-methyl-D-erythritol 4-phosphate cytidylyltransferase [Lachnospiraceae bacterium]|nr:2-C-methyl-D-erythritol 4-phosphate cytidylyltransferase [Lachnospiraceae bacterium]